MEEVKREEFKGGKSITLEGDLRLKEIQKKVNQGDFKRKYSERDIISEAILCFSDKDVDRLGKERASGEEVLMSSLKEIFKNEGGETGVSFDEFLKKSIAPMLVQKNSKKRGNSNKIKPKAEVSL